MALAWPDVLKPTSIGFWLENTSRGGGAALSGQEQRVYSPDQRWRARIDVPIRNNEQILAFRKLVARADGAANSIDVPAFEGKRANWPVDAWGRTLNPSFTRRKALDGTAYEDSAIPAASFINMQLDADAAIRATTIAINQIQGTEPQEGQYVSIAGRLYVLRSKVSEVSSVHTFEIRPPLRAAAATGALVRAANPTCEMRFADDAQAEMTLDLAKYANLTLNFVEYF